MTLIEVMGGDQEGFWYEANLIANVLGVEF